MTYGTGRRRNPTPAVARLPSFASRANLKRRAVRREGSCGVAQRGDSWDVGGSCASRPKFIQSGPHSSTGCCARSVPLPQRMASAGQYFSQPQQMRSGWPGCRGIFGAMPRCYSPGAPPALTNINSTALRHRGASQKFTHGCTCARRRSIIERARDG